MEKNILVRVGIIMSIFVLIILASVGCTYLTRDKSTTPGIEDGDEIYASYNGEDITKQELWDVMKKVDGYSYLVEYIDRILLEYYISGIDQSEIDEKIELLTYGTNDQETIAKIVENDEVHQKFIEQFRNTLTISGYDPDNADDLRRYVELSIAQYKYAEEYILNADEDDEYAITPLAVLEYYENTAIGDACVVPLRFNSAEEAQAVFDEFKLVPNFNDGWGKYVGSTPIEDVESDGFDLSNTTQLNTPQIFEKYLELYNYLNPWQTPIPTDITFESYCNDYADIAVMNYMDMSEGRDAGDALYDLANYTFNTLSVSDTEKDRFSVNIQQIDDFSMLVFKVSEEEVKDYLDLTTEEKDALVDEMLEQLLINDVVQDLMTDLREENELELFDPVMKLQYEFEFQTKFDNDGSDTLIATYGDVDITADELFDFMAERVGLFYTVELAKLKLVVGSEFYVDIYGKERDYYKNNTDAMKLLRDQLSATKARFEANQFALYGFSKDVYTYNEFLMLAYQAENETEYLVQNFIYERLQSEYVLGRFIDYDKAVAYAQEQLDNYFSLDAEHLLIYVDFDYDFDPDEHDKLVEGFTAEELTEYNLLKVLFDELVTDRLEAEMTLDEIVDEYEASLLTDPDNEWAPLKAYGFRIKTEVLADLNYNTGQNLDDAFFDAIVDLYERYNRTENADLEELVQDGLVESVYGVHKIIATKGDTFEVPSAKFEEADANDREYSVGAENDNDLPTKEQFDLYVQYVYEVEIKQGTSKVKLPAEVMGALEYYFGKIVDNSFTSTVVSIAGIHELMDKNITFADNNDEQVAFLEEILAALYDSVFKGDVTYE